MPAKAGIQLQAPALLLWIPAFAGMTFVDVRRVSILTPRRPMAGD